MPTNDGDWYGRPGWRFGDLVDHLTAQHRGFAAAAAGLGAELASWAARPAGTDAVEDAVRHGGRRARRVRRFLTHAGLIA